MPSLKRLYLPVVNFHDVARIHRLSAEDAHYVHHVLRMKIGERLEVFNDQGQTVQAEIIAQNTLCFGAVVEDTSPASAAPTDSSLTLAVAVPKGERSDWLVEKCSELGATELCWIATERSVIRRVGDEKMQRWQRKRIQAAQQSGHLTALQIAPLCSFDDFIRQPCRGFGMLCSPNASPSVRSLSQLKPCNWTVLIGPEGGFTAEEESAAVKQGYALVALPVGSILRIETAAMMVCCLWQHLRHE